MRRELPKPLPRSTALDGVGAKVRQYALVADDIKPYILTSMLKRVDIATYEAIADQLFRWIERNRSLVRLEPTR